MQTTFKKSITAQFEQVGRRQKLVGQLGEIRDETGILIHSQLYNTPFEAEIKLDALTRELLTDYAERGLVDTLPEVTGTCQCRTCIQPATHNVDGTLACCFHYSEELTGVLCGCTDDDYADTAWESDHGSYNGKVPSDFTQVDPVTAHTAQRLANNTGVPTYVVKQHGHFLIQDDADLDCYGGRADVVATYQPAQPHAVTLTSIIIDQAAQRNRLCQNCQGAHYTWQCPQIAQRLFADDTSWKDIALGRELCRMRWRNCRAFVALLLSVPAEHLMIYAASYQAFVRDHNPASDLTINQVLASWTNEIRRNSSATPALQQAA